MRDGAGVEDGDEERVAAEPTYVDPGGAVREGGGGESLDRELDELDELDPEDDVPDELEPDEPDAGSDDEPDDELDDDEPPLRGTACWADAHAATANPSRP